MPLKQEKRKGLKNACEQAAATDGQKRFLMDDLPRQIARLPVGFFMAEFCAICPVAHEFVLACSDMVRRGASALPAEKAAQLF